MPDGSTVTQEVTIATLKVIKQPPIRVWVSGINKGMDASGNTIWEEDMSVPAFAKDKGFLEEVAALLIKAADIKVDGGIIPKMMDTVDKRRDAYRAAMKAKEEER